MAGTFWDTLATSGAALASKVVAPLSGGINTGIKNLVQTGTNKVTAISDTIAKTTDPNKPAASQPATPPTSTAPTKAAATQAKLGIMIVVGLVILLLVMRGRK